MRLVIATLICVGALACDLSAQSIVVINEVDLYLTTDSFPSYRIDAPYTANDVWIRYDRIQRTVTPALTTLAYPETQLFLVEPGDLFNDTNIRSGQFPKLHFFGLLQPVPVGNSDFYLGIAQLSEDSSGLFGEFPGTFGWMHLRPTNIGNGLEMLENVVSYRTRGIIVGTTTIVPEPASAGLVVAGFAGLFIRRRNNFPNDWLTSALSYCTNRPGIA